jgi:hypothetical protein
MNNPPSLKLRRARGNIEFSKESGGESFLWGQVLGCSEREDMGKRGRGRQLIIAVIIGFKGISLNI